MLESVISWLTPTALFLLLNLVIGTIAFTSSRSSSSDDLSASAAGGPHHTSSKLFRSPSIVLDRLKSFNLYSSSYRPSDPATTETIQTVQIPKIEQCEPEPEAPEPEHHISRSQSDTQPAAGEVPKKLAKKMKKSATLKSAFNHFDFHEQEQESSSRPKRPATMREREKEKEKDEDAEVDARADDFINRFKQQLKLQRLDSIIRYKEMLNRGN